MFSLKGEGTRGDLQHQPRLHVPVQEGFRQTGGIYKGPHKPQLPASCQPQLSRPEKRQNSNHHAVSRSFSTAMHQLTMYTQYRIAGHLCPLDCLFGSARICPGRLSGELVLRRQLSGLCRVLCRQRRRRRFVRRNEYRPIVHPINGRLGRRVFQRG